MTDRFAVSKHHKRVNYAWEVYRLDETGGYTGEAGGRCAGAKMAQLVAALLTAHAAKGNLFEQRWQDIFMAKPYGFDLI